MAGLNFIGSYSGIDQSAIDKLMEVERLPLKKYTTQKTNITTQQNAWKDVNNRLNSLYEKIKALSKMDTFTSRVSTSTNDKMVTMTVGSSAPEGSYKIKVDQLATSTSLIGDKLTGGKVTSNGSFTINALSTEDLKEKVDNRLFDDYIKEKEYRIDKDGKVLDKDGNQVLDENGLALDKDALKASAEYTTYSTAKRTDIENSIKGERTIGFKVGDSLNSIAKQINEKSKETGVTATVVDGRMVLQNSKTGTGGMDLAGDLAAINLNPSKIEAGKQAQFTINGVTVISDSNNVSGVLEGTTINLLKAHKVGDDSDYDTLTVGLDTEKLTAAVEDFVKQFNSTKQFIEDQIKAGTPDVSGSRGALAGDGSLMRLHAQLSNLVTSKIGTDKDDIGDFSQLGVTTIDRFGQLQFDSAKLIEAVKDNPDKVMKFFSNKETIQVDGKDKEVDKGLVGKLNAEIDTFITGDKGIIKIRNESFEKMLKNINRRIEDFEERMVKKEERLVKQFTALDVAMMKAESQMTWLQGQVDAMNGIKR